MNSMKLKIIVLLTTFFLLISFSLNLAAMGNRGNDLEVVKIGVVLPLTGDAAVYGKAIQNGIELALEELNNNYPMLAPIYEDDRGNPNDSVNAISRLINLEKVPIIIGGAQSSTAEPVVPIINEKKVLLLSPCATKPSLTKDGGYFFSTLAIGYL